ncbi:MAG: excinuclease ABC subunit UvrB [Patescibacteria group bacterium]
MKFKLHSPYQPTGDQPQAIKQIVESLDRDQDTQVLLGVTGSGKTFTMANVIEQVQRPTLVIAHNKTLAVQLYQEFRDFFPNNAVSYFVSYYDYYQPEAYIPQTDTYIEKEATINEEIDKLRLAATTNLITRPDVIIVASVSCIYSLSSPVEYGRFIFELVEGEVISLDSIMNSLTNLQYERSTTDLKRGTFRVRGENIQVWPAYMDEALRIEMTGDKVSKVTWIDALSGTPQKLSSFDPHHPQLFVIFPAKHYVVDPTAQKTALAEIRADLATQLKKLVNSGHPLEALRLKQKVTYDLEMIEQFGFVGGIENYSKYFDGRQIGQPPFTLLDYFKYNNKQFGGSKFLTFIDESHMTIPQIGGMFKGDESRKKTLIEYGFRLPSALENRPLKFDEFIERIDQVVAVSATPGEWERQETKGQMVEQLVRPTGLVDPVIYLRSTQHQIEDLVVEIINRKQLGQRCLVTTLTKKMAEVLTDYLNDAKKIKKLIQSFQARQKLRINQIDPDKVIQEASHLNVDILPIGQIPDSHLSTADASLIDLKKLTLPKVAYLHSDIVTLERSQILQDLRQGKYDVLVGINLLREGLDLPEVSLVAVLDADKEGFLRSETALVQTMGRAARHLAGEAILYADKLTKSLKSAISETSRRRQYQLQYNQKHSITPRSINKPFRKEMVARSLDDLHPASSPVMVKLSPRDSIQLDKLDPNSLTPMDKKKAITQLKRAMEQAALELDFELAAQIRDVLQTF